MNILDHTDKVMSHYHNGKLKGEPTGFKCLDELITFKPKYTTYIQGFPKCGKTEMHLEILFNLTEKSGARHAVMSPEIGGVEDVIAELVSKHLRKPFFKSSYNAPQEREVYQAMNELSQYFFVLDNDSKDYNIDTFFEDCIKIEKDNKIKLFSTSIDPWNDLDEDLQKFGGREDKYLAHALRKVRSTAKNNNWHNFIVTHSKESAAVEYKHYQGGKVTCTPMPTLQTFAGGQVWSRRAFNVIGMWRPEEGAINPKTHQPFDENAAVIKVLKAKPKGVGKLGSAYLYFDWRKNRYFEKYNEKNLYAYEHIKEDEELARIEKEKGVIDTSQTQETLF